MDRIECRFGFGSGLSLAKTKKWTVMFAKVRHSQMLHLTATRFSVRDQRSTHPPPMDHGRSNPRCLRLSAYGSESTKRSDALATEDRSSERQIRSNDH